MALISLDRRKSRGANFRNAARLWTRIGLLTCAGFAVALSGCQKHPFEVAPVRGKITIDGEPLSAGKVMFAPIAKGENHEAGRTAMGRLQADGTFLLTTYDDGDGAVVGEHWVTIFGGSDAKVSTLPKFARLVVPERKTVVGSQENEIDIQLTRQEVARLGTKE